MTESQETSPLSEPADGQAERVDWRSSAYAAIIVTLLAGVWLILSGALLEYSKPALALICGIAIVAVSVVRFVAAPWSRILAYVSAGLGALTAISAVAAPDPIGETVNMALVGLATVILSLVGLSARAAVERRSRA